MLPDRRAVVFDLDDTLYPYRHFVLSGFRAVAERLHGAAGVDPAATLAQLVRAGRGRDRGRELQACLREFRLPETWITELVDTLHNHEPRLRMPVVVRRLLRSLRADGWHLGVLTNGPVARQARKVRALGVERYVDRVVYAASCGSGTGKPEVAAFVSAARRLDVPVGHTVFVGNDERADIAGAVAAGMVALRCDVWTGPQGPTCGTDVVVDVSTLPQMIRKRLKEATSRHAA